MWVERWKKEPSVSETRHCITVFAFVSSFLSLSKSIRSLFLSFSLSLSICLFSFFLSLFLFIFQYFSLYDPRCQNSIQHIVINIHLKKHYFNIKSLRIHTIGWQFFGTRSLLSEMVFGSLNIYRKYSQKKHRPNFQPSNRIVATHIYSYHMIIAVKERDLIACAFHQTFYHDAMIAFFNFVSAVLWMSVL